jgi:hypothetical protein
MLEVEKFQSTITDFGDRLFKRISLLSLQPISYLVEVKKDKLSRVIISL